MNLFLQLVVLLKRLNRDAGVAAAALLTVYKRCISPLLGHRCRFYPSCSDYGRQVFRQEGMARGGLLVVSRLCRCHPFCKGGVDFPPGPRQKDCL